MSEKLPTKTNVVPISSVLPYEARMMLQKAARTVNTEYDPRAREKAIDAAIRKIRGMYPSYFHDEESEYETGSR